jgi:hypothetical protein
MDQVKTNQKVLEKYINVYIVNVLSFRLFRMQIHPDIGNSSGTCRKVDNELRKKKVPRSHKLSQHMEKQVSISKWCIVLGSSLINLERK